MGEKRGALQPFWSGGAYTRFFEVPFIYDDLRDQGLRSIVIDQQAGLGLAWIPTEPFGPNIRVSAVA